MFKLSITLSDEQVADILCSALEGGSNYWYEIIKMVSPTTWGFESDPGAHYVHDYPLNPGGVLLIRDQLDNDQKTLRLNRSSLKKGLSIMFEKYPLHFADILNENADAITGDVLLQCCLFGKVIYG